MELPPKTTANKQYGFELTRAWGRPVLRGRSVLSLAAGARMAVARPRQTIMVIHVATDRAAGTVDNPAALPPHLRVLGCPAYDTDKGSWWPWAVTGPPYTALV